MNLDAIGIVSKDLEASVKFYGILGVTFQEAGGPDHFEAVTASGVRLMLDSVDLAKKLNPSWQAQSGSGVVLCFKQENPQHVDKIHLNMVKSGSTTEQ